MIKYIRLFIAVQSQKRLSGTGNVYRILFHRQYNGREDDLSYDYGNEGNRLLSITDNGQGSDQYDVIEYHNSNIQADTTFRYDANGNLIYDLDRGISVIKYNILNLPDTIQFSNGNQIVNLYDAAGRKYKTITYFAPETAGTSHYEIEHYTFDTDTVTYAVTEYAGNIETIINGDSVITKRIFNSIGYYSDSTYYHYIKDHLGNICAVVNSVKDSVIQSTLYYASGVPMAQSIGRDKQPYLYNGKEFVEAHGWNAYDYGFRGYYATIGRFTSIDPLAEQTPWQSPYAYADNNFINAIDWMGLGGTTGFSHSGDVCQYIVYDGHTGIILDYDLEDDDRGVYVYWGEDWVIGGDRNDLQLVGWHRSGLGVCQIMGSGGVINFNAGIMESFACLPQDVPCYGKMPNVVQKATDVAQNVANQSNNIITWGSEIMSNRFWWRGRNGKFYSTSLLDSPQRYVYNRSYQISLNKVQKLTKATKYLGVTSIILDGAEIVLDKEIKPSNAINSTVVTCAFIPALEWVPVVYGIVDVTTLAITGKSLGDMADDYWGPIKRF